MSIYRDFLYQEAPRRGIAPAIAERVANSEGGLTEPARRGTFATGSSWYAFQLHWGGPGYEHFGTVAGMGNEFTRVTGWQPGDPDAWRDAMRWALDAAKRNGWGAWYGAAHVGISRWQGIDRSHPWGGTPADEWDYKGGAVPEGPQPAPSFNAGSNALAQNDSWSCAPTSLRWALWSVGRKPSEDWIESTMVAEGVVSHNQGLLDASGAGLAAFVERHYGYDCGSKGSVSYDEVVAMAGSRPVLIGGRAWGGEGHWSGVRGYDPNRGLLLANPADGWGGIGQVIDRQQWGPRGSWSAMWIEVQGAEQPPAEPGPTAPTVEGLQGIIREYESQVAALRDEITALKTTLYVIRDDKVAVLHTQATDIQFLCEEAVGVKT